MKANSTKSKKVNALVESILDTEYGVTLGHADIAAIINVKERSPEYRAVVKKANTILLKSGKALQNVFSIGYKVMQPDAYVDQSLKQFKRGFKSVQRGTDILSCAPVNQMSAEGRKVHRDVTDRARILHASMVGGCTELRMLGNKNSALLPENVGRR